MTTTKKLSAKAKMRILIAKDTLKWLAAKKLKLAPGTYFNLPNKSVPTNNSKKDLNRKLDKVLETVSKPCDVCALGGMFYSMVRRYDGVKLYEGNTEYASGPNGSEVYVSSVTGSIVYDRLKKYFSAQQLGLIETAFEETIMGNCVNNDNDYYRLEDARVFAYNKPSATRLKMIMENIIKNKGEFNPPKTNDD
jgi:hypothetical protein